ncbi:MAG: ABC transporter ATP-binding protein [Candidatus Atribacteria bacterium]|nr:ABC transporter ATP-binding protein [Candidatus Atribacteria bacterium]
MEETPAIKLSGITKWYGSVQAVCSVNLDIRQGEFFSLLGPSGCGKTTTLRVIAGLESPTAGRVYLEGEDVTDVPPYRRNVNTVFQDYALFPHMTVEENIYFPLRMRKISRVEARPMIQEALALVNMSGFEKRYPHQLSGGQRQRIALARALVNRPKALLLDEPLGALDFKLRVAMQKVLKDIQRNVRITFVYVTHDQTEAITMSDRICVMKDGLIHQVGTSEEIYNSPSSIFVAGFIGDMNFMEGVVTERHGDEVVVDVNGFIIRSGRPMGNFVVGEKVMVCVRPEKICAQDVCNLEDMQRFDNRFQAVITRIVFRGNDYEITVGLGEASMRLIESASDFKGENEGDSLYVGFLKEDVLLYPLQAEEEKTHEQLD